jgi:hypothetical protein
MRILDKFLSQLKKVYFGHTFGQLNIPLQPAVRQKKIKKVPIILFFKFYIITRVGYFGQNEI